MLPINLQGLFFRGVSLDSLGGVLKHEAENFGHQLDTMRDDSESSKLLDMLRS